MNTPEWIIAGILSFMLMVFLILGIIVLYKFLDLSRDAKHILKEIEKITKKSKNIVNKADEAVTSATDDLAQTTSSIKNAVKTTIKNKLS